MGYSVPRSISGFRGREGREWEKRGDESGWGRKTVGDWRANHVSLETNRHLKLSASQRNATNIKQFRNSFETVSFQFHFVVRTVWAHSYIRFKRKHIQQSERGDNIPAAAVWADCAAAAFDEAGWRGHRTADTTAAPAAGAVSVVPAAAAAAAPSSSDAVPESTESHWTRSSRSTPFTADRISSRFSVFLSEFSYSYVRQTKLTSSLAMFWAHDKNTDLLIGWKKRTLQQLEKARFLILKKF